MPQSEPLETAVMFWAGGDPAQTIAELISLGIHSGQLGIPGDLDLSCAPQWRDALRAALAHETAHATVVIVAQRVSTIRDADRIVVLNEGRVVGTGTHAELMDGNETYREIVLSQLTEKEAAPA